MLSHKRWQICLSNPWMDRSQICKQYSEPIPLVQIASDSNYFGFEDMFDCGLLKSSSTWKNDGEDSEDTWTGGEYLIVGIYNQTDHDWREHWRYQGLPEPSSLRGSTLGTRAAEHKSCNWGMQIDWWLQPRAVFGHTFSGIIWHMSQK